MSEEQVKSLQHLIPTGQGFANECRLTHTHTHYILYLLLLVVVLFFTTFQTIYAIFSFYLLIRS